MAEIRDLVLVDALAVRSAMADRVHHPSQIRLRRGFSSQVYESGYPAHVLNKHFLAVSAVEQISTVAHTLGECPGTLA